MNIALTEYTLPVYWASYLINDDPSGLDDAEYAEVKAWMARVNPGFCVDCSEESFFKWGNDANTLGADCLTYTFQK